AEMARITASSVAGLGVEEVRIARCGPYLWARLSGGRSETDLLFTTRVLLEQRSATSSNNRPMASEDDWVGEPRALSEWSSLELPVFDGSGPAIKCRSWEMIEAFASHLAWR